jgi:hypothetical protein
MRKKQTLSWFSLGGIQPTNIEVEKPETLRDVAIRLEREDRQRREAPVRAAERELNETVARIHADIAETWRLPIEKLQKYDKRRAEALYVDLGLPKQNHDVDWATAVQFVKDEFKRFVEALPSRGFVLDREGSWRFQSLIQVQGDIGGVRIDQSSLQTIFDWMVRHEVFSATELRYVPELIPPAPVAQKPIENAADKRDREVRAVIGDRRPPEFEDIELKWHKSVRDNFGYTLSHLQHREVWKYIQARNLNPCVPATWDECRRFLVHRSLAPSSLLLASDVLADDLRTGAIDEKTYWQRCKALELEGKLNRPRSEAGHS